MHQTLSDIKLLDLTHYVAGPYCTKMFADYGAEVIKVERPGSGDGARRLGPFPGDEPHPEKSGLFLHLNTNKKGVTLNLRSATGVRLLKELIRQADILVESFAPRVMPSLGLSYEEIEQVNPRLVMTSISTFGQTGPYRDYAATELTAFAMGLHMHNEGEPDREPLRFPGPRGQYLAGSHAAAVTFGAYFGAARWGQGQHVDVSILECMAAPPEAGAVLMNYQFTGNTAGRLGHRREGAYPFGVYACKDGHVFIYGVVGFFWPRIAAWLGMPELVDDPRFATPLARLEHHGDFDAIFLPWLLERTQQEVFRSAQVYRIPVTPVYTVDELLRDRQLNARGFFTEIAHPVAGAFTYPGLPFKLPESASRPQRPAPLLGQHNREIYGERLGYGREDLVRLRQMGVI